MDLLMCEFTLRRGGVLEPEGIVEIKFKDKDIRKTIHRIDPVIIKYKSDLTASADAPADQKTKLETLISKREMTLKPMYHQVAVHFADLHDTPNRMLEKGVITGIVSWPEARRIFYWRLRRLVIQNQIKRQILVVQPHLNDGQVVSMVRRWFAEEVGTSNVHQWDDNESMVQWFGRQLDEGGDIDPDSLLDQNVASLQKDSFFQNMRCSISESSDMTVELLVKMYEALSPSQRSEVVRMQSMINAKQDAQDSTNPLENS